MNSPARDITFVEKKLQATLRRSDVTHAQFQETAQRAQEVHGRVSAAKGRQELGEEVQRMLEALQNRAHERSVGAFERLLTAILGDVLPGEGQVKLHLGMRHNAAALDIFLEKQPGKLEDVLEGNGGAVVNVLSSGLRFAALSRTKKHRRLMVLDEPDCWIIPERIPAFVNVLAKVSNASHFQTFFISHHDSELFEASVNVLKLGRDENGKVMVCAETHVSDDWESDEVPGIRAMELINVRQHEHTVLRFRPGATAVVGKNNLGKSTAIHSALKAVAYGESADDIIRHGCDEATIVLHLERNRRLVWNRRLKRSPVVTYELYQGDELISSGRPGKRNEAPAWVVDELGITPVDDLDVQLRNQKKPVFLLDDSASRRAQVLSIGRESGYLQKLFVEYEALKLEDRETVKQGEAEFARLTWRLKGKDDADQLPRMASEVSKTFEGLRQCATQFAALQEHLGMLERQAARIASARNAIGLLPQSVTAPKPEDPRACRAAVSAAERGLLATQLLRNMPAPPKRPTAENPAACGHAYTTIARGERLRAINLIAVPKAPSREGPAEVVRLGAAIRRGFTMKELYGKINKSIAAPRSTAPQELHLLVDALGKLQASTNQHRKTLEAANAEDAVVKAEERTLRAQLGDHCPTCRSRLPETGFLHVH